MTSSAPAKVILFGEHAVVYGHPAIAAPFDTLRATVESSPGEPGAGLTIRAHDTGHEYYVVADEASYGDTLSFAAQLALVELDALPPPDLILDVRSTIPIASGLGSGAAVTAAMLRELCRALGKPLSDDRLNALVYESEKLLHGTPSGIDNTVIVYDQPVYFVRGSAPERFRIHTPLTLVIADSGIAHSTRETVADVRALAEAPDTAYDTARVLRDIGSAVTVARTAIETGNLARIGELMIINQKLLAKLSVSSPLLEMLCAAAQTAGAYGAKLSGGGRGGNVIALVPPELADSVAVALRTAGAARTWTTVIR